MIPKKHRLRLPKDIQAVHRAHQKICGSFLCLSQKESIFDFPRFTAIISKKTVKNATARNRLRRIIMAEAVKSLCESTKQRDIIFSLNKAKNSKQNLTKSLEKAIRKDVSTLCAIVDKKQHK